MTLERQWQDFVILYQSYQEIEMDDLYQMMIQMHEKPNFPRIWLGQLEIP